MLRNGVATLESRAARLNSLPPAAPHFPLSQPSTPQNTQREPLSQAEIEQLVLKLNEIEVRASGRGGRERQTARSSVARKRQPSRP